MKKLFLLFCFVCLSVIVNAQYQVSFYNDGYWGEWKNAYGAEIRGNYDGFCLYFSGEHPSKYFFKFEIDNYREPSKEEIKWHKKNNKLFEYNGTVEYYATDDYPSFSSLIKVEQFNSPSGHDVSKGQRPCVKRTIKAVIKIQPYKYSSNKSKVGCHPTCYNIYADGVGIGINLGSLYFLSNWKENTC